MLRRRFWKVGALITMSAVLAVFGPICTGIYIENITPVTIVETPSP